MGDIFKAVPGSGDPRLLVGYENSDDAAVFRLDNGTLLVQSVDFFTPIVDDPYDFGAVAAANALSDIFAMGGTPLTALAIVCFPIKELDGEILAAVNAGGADKIREAGAVVVGGHSVRDPELKFGYAVTGTVSENRFWRNDSCRPGDALVISKPLGTGLLTTAVKKDLLPAATLDPVLFEMKRLNDQAARIAADYQIHACTDITGFGLLGHLFEMLRTQQMGAELIGGQIPVFEGVEAAIQHKAFTGAHTTNAVYVGDYVEAGNEPFKKLEKVLFDPQTSGPLLFSLPADEAPSLAAALKGAGHRAAIIGTTSKQPGIRIH